MTWNVVEKKGPVLVWNAFGEMMTEYPMDEVVSNPDMYMRLTNEFGAPTGLVKTYKVLVEA
jgi:hypothetical protein